MAKVRHVGITVSDLDQALHLYGNIFGFQTVVDVIEEGPFVDNLALLDNVKVRVVKMKDPHGGMIELLNYLSHPESSARNKQEKITAIGCSHMALTVEQLDALYQTLLEEGLTFNHSPQVSPDGKAKVAFCRDYDGTLLELVEQLET